MSPVSLVENDGYSEKSQGGRPASDGPSVLTCANAEDAGGLAEAAAPGGGALVGEHEPVLAAPGEGHAVTFWLVILGNGSWSGKDFHYRAGVHEVDAERAAHVLAWKATHPGASWVVVSTEKPELESGSLIGPLRPEDMLVGTASGVRFPKSRQEPVQTAALEAPDAPQALFPCKWCERRFRSAARLRRHIRHAHTIRHEQVEARVQEQLEADRKQKAEQHRAEDAARNPDRDLENLHPAEREPLER